MDSLRLRIEEKISRLEPGEAEEATSANFDPAERSPGAKSVAVLAKGFPSSLPSERSWSKVSQASTVVEAEN